MTFVLGENQTQETKRFELTKSKLHGTTVYTQLRSELCKETKNVGQLRVGEQHDVEVLLHPSLDIGLPLPHIKALAANSKTQLQQSWQLNKTGF
jgi:hypothetical protein